jgi:predicted secreted hydrolase
MLTRRGLIARSLFTHALPGLGALSASSMPLAAWALPERTLRFPRDFGAHPDLRTEWWYITGHALGSQGPKTSARELGFQLTFFRTRVDATQSLQSKFAARQLIFAHAAVTDVQGRKLWHDQRIAREGLGLAGASTEDTRLQLGNWRLERNPTTGQYSASLPTPDFALELTFNPTQPLLLQGRQGLSRKGPEASQASYYYSQPQLAASGQISLRGQRFDVSGKAWLDHEWSQALLHPEARGWDWVGMNLDDGRTLTAFQLRRADGSALWGGGSFRSAQEALKNFSHREVMFKPLRFWQSPLTQARYPVEWQLRTAAGDFVVRAVIDAQELDSRQSTGAVYWEGLSELFDSQGLRVGRGYLEMTGYAAALKL